MSKHVVIAGPAHLAMLADRLPQYSGEGIPLPTGSGGYNLTMMVRERILRGMPTDLVTLSPDLEVPIARWKGDGLNLWVVKRRTKKAIRSLYKDERYLLAQAIEESGADLCHANWTYEFGMAAARQTKMPWVLTAHDHSWNYLWKSSYDYLPLFGMSLYVMRRARHLSVVSEYLRPWVRLAGGKDPVVIPNMISIPEGLESRESDSLKVAAALAWAKHKNVTGCLRAFHAFIHAGGSAELHLMGPGLEEEGPAHQWARQEGLADRVRFLGNRNHSEVLETFSSSRAVFHPSLEESFGMPVAEAMWLGIPVVAAKQAGGSRWLVGASQYGELADGLSPREMADGLHRVLERSDDVLDKVARAQERIRKLCSPDAVLDAYEAWYQDSVHSN
jgi:glycosyltransferase involved in cell wall biosynthesis